MADFISYENPYGDDKIYDACGLLAMMDTSGQCFSGHDIVKGITNMEERGNGLGAGLAAYGCYPEHADCYAVHVMYTDWDSRPQVEEFLQEHFILIDDEEVPHLHTPDLATPPLVWRYFLRLDKRREVVMAQGEGEYVVGKVMEVNTAGEGADIYSSGKNTGVFKGVGHPGQIAEYFGIEEYSGYLWTARNSFPTNTRGGGEEPTRSAFSTGQSFTMERFLHTAPTGATWRCRGITAQCRRTPK